MNKKLFGFAFALVFVLTGLVFGNFTNVAKATSATITVSNITQTSADIKVTNLDIPTPTYNILVSDIDRHVYYFDKEFSTANDKTPSINVNNLLKDGKYLIALFTVDKSGEIGGSEVAEYSFETSLAKLDSSALNGMITVADTALENAVGGSSNGEYPYASIQTLKDAVAKADRLDLKSTSITQIDVNVTLAELESALNTFQLSKIGGVLNTSELIGMITEANRVLGEAKDADYPNGAKDKLSAAITKADRLDLKSTSITQTDVDATLAELESALNTFQSSKIVATNRSKNTGNIVPICNTIVDTVKGGYSNPCDFNALILLINNVIKFLLFTIATPFIALILVYAGWLYLSASASPKNIETAKTIFKNAILGYVLALAAWLIIHTIMTSLNFNGEMYLASIISNMFV